VPPPRTLRLNHRYLRKIIVTKHQRTVLLYVFLTKYDHFFALLIARKNIPLHFELFKKGK